MAELLVMTFDKKSTALETHDALEALQQSEMLDMEDVVAVTRTTEGEVKLHESRNLPVLQTVGGMVWGAVLGAAFLMPVVGAAIGAGAGAVTGHLSDTGIDDDFLKGIGRTLEPGKAAVCILVRYVSADELLDALANCAPPKGVLRAAIEDGAIDSLRKYGDGGAVTNSYRDLQGMT